MFLHAVTAGGYTVQEANKQLSELVHLHNLKLETNHIRKVTTGTSSSSSSNSNSNSNSNNALSIVAVAVAVVIFR